jgi:PPOX class probable F420-dependent enzyme
MEANLSQTVGTETVERPARRHEDLKKLLPGRYLSVTSFKRDGTGVATPVWAVSDGKRLFALTDLHSAKIRRIRRNPEVLVAPCWVNGKPRRAPLPARAEVLTSNADLERVQGLLREHYKISYRLVMLFYRLGRRLRGDQAVADGAALAIALESGDRTGVEPVRGSAPAPSEADRPMATRQ